MAQYTGSALSVSFKGTVISTRFVSFEPSEEVELADQTAGADTNKTYLTTLKDGEASLEVLDVAGGTAATALWNLCVLGAEGTLQWGPEGTASNKPKHWANAIVKSREKSMPYEDVVKATITFQFSGAVTDTTF